MASFSACSLPGVFCHHMLQALSGLDIAYSDDILVYSASWKENLQYLQQVFECLKKAKVKNKLSKCKFLQKQLHHLGHIISEQGTQPLLEKVSATEKLKEPSSIDELCHWPLFADITKPLNKRKYITNTSYNP